MADRPSGIHPWAIVGHPPQHFRGYEESIEPLVDPTVYVGAFSSVDCGTVRATTVGAGTYIMQRCNIGHDAVIGHDCDVADGSVIGGHSDIGNHVRIGIGTIILPYRTVGDHARTGAGAVVVDNVPAYAVVAGNPAKILYYICQFCGEKSDASSCADCRAAFGL